MANVSVLFVCMGIDFFRPARQEVRWFGYILDCGRPMATVDWGVSFDRRRFREIRVNQRLLSGQAVTLSPLAVMNQQHFFDELAAPSGTYPP